MDLYYRDKNLINSITLNLFKGKAIILYGARQVGKTTLLEKILNNYKEKKIVKYNCDDSDDIDLLSNKGATFLKNLINQYDIIFIDEIQKLPNAGNTIKLLVDHYKDQKQIILSGSSTIEINNHLVETLTGRKRTFKLFPFSLNELIENQGASYLYKNLNNILIYGSYPEVETASSFSEKEVVLEEIVDSYLYKDILELEGIRNSFNIKYLVKLLAYQIGREVSTNELSNTLGISRNTVEKYLDLLQKSFVIFPLPAYSTNKRREIKKNNKIYFYDTGIRNAIIKDFRIPENRDDLPNLWENYIVAEKLKQNTYHQSHSSLFFWRTFDGAEIDLVEEKHGEALGYEIKFNPKKKAKPPKSWLDKSNTSFEKIDTENFIDFFYIKEFN